MTPLDRHLFWRTLGVAVAVLLVTAIVVASTDEATSTTGMRVARLAALSPLLGAASVFGVAEHLRVRGDAQALAAAGASPWGAVRGARVAGLAVGVFGVAALLSPWADATSLFPVVAVPLSWTFDAAAHVAHSAIAIVGPGGALEVQGSALITRSPAPSSAAVPCIAPFVAAAPEWAATPMRPALRIGSVAAASCLAVTLLHLIAAERIPAANGLFAALPLALATYQARRRG